MAVLVLGACGRLNFEDRSSAQPDAAGNSDGIVDQAADACSGVDPDTIALFSFEGALGADASGTHSGTIEGNVTPGSGRCGASSAVFDSGHVLVPDDAAFDLATGSIELFVRLSSTSTADNQGLVTRDAQGTNLDGHFSIFVTSTAEIVARLQFGGVSFHRCAGAFPTMQWVHVGVSFGGDAAQGLRMWIDGVEATAASATVGGAAVDCTGQIAEGISGNDNALVIGASNARTSAEGATVPVITQPVLGGEIDQVHLRNTWRDFAD